MDKSSSGNQDNHSANSHSSSNENEEVGTKYRELSEADRLKLNAQFRTVINPLTAKTLTTRSFVLSLKDLLKNVIEFNPLFYNKEYLVQTAVNSIEKRHEHGEFTRRAKTATATTTTAAASSRFAPSSTGRFNPTRIHADFTEEGSVHERVIKNKLYNSNYLSDFVWKAEMPGVFCELENYVSPNYRESVNPPLSATKFSPKNLQDFRQQISQSAHANRKKNRTSHHHHHHQHHHHLSVAHVSNHSTSSSAKFSTASRKMTKATTGGKKTKADVDEMDSNSDFSSNSYSDLNNALTNSGGSRKKSVFNNY
jgi:hypothetical protein